MSVRNLAAIGMTILSTSITVFIFLRVVRIAVLQSASIHVDYVAQRIQNVNHSNGLINIAAGGKLANV